MEDLSEELNSAILHAKKHLIERANSRFQKSDNVNVKRYLCAVAVNRQDAFGNKTSHNGRRSRSLTRVYVEERHEREKSAPSLARASLNKEEQRVQEEEFDRIRWEYHEKLEGNLHDMLENDKADIEDLKSKVSSSGRNWDHVHDSEQKDYDTYVTRVGDHLFGFDKARDLNVELPGKVYFFFTGKELKETHMYRSLPNLSSFTSDQLRHSSFSNLSHQGLYGHGFRKGDTSTASRDIQLHSHHIENREKPRMPMGYYKSSQDVFSSSRSESHVPVRPRALSPTFSTSSTIDAFMRTPLETLSERYLTKNEGRRVQQSTEYLSKTVELPEKDFENRPRTPSTPSTVVEQNYEAYVPVVAAAANVAQYSSSHFHSSSNYGSATVTTEKIEISSPMVSGSSIYQHVPIISTRQTHMVVAPSVQAELHIEPVTSYLEHSASQYEHITSPAISEPVYVPVKPVRSPELASSVSHYATSCVKSSYQNLDSQSYGYSSVLAHQELAQTPIVSSPRSPIPIVSLPDTHDTHNHYATGHIKTSSYQKLDSQSYGHSTVLTHQELVETPIISIPMSPIPIVSVPRSPTTPKTPSTPRPIYLLPYAEDAGHFEHDEVLSYEEHVTSPYVIQASRDPSVHVNEKEVYQEHVIVDTTARYETIPIVRELHIEDDVGFERFRQEIAPHLVRSFSDRSKKPVPQQLVKVSVEGTELNKQLFDDELWRIAQINERSKINVDVHGEQEETRETKEVTTWIYEDTAHRDEHTELYNAAPVEVHEDDYYSSGPVTTDCDLHRSVLTETITSENAYKFAEAFTANLAKVEDVLKDSAEFRQKSLEEEVIYDHVSDERIYDSVAKDEDKLGTPPPTPVITFDTHPLERQEELHYAAVAIAKNHADLYRDDSNIYEEINDVHVIDSGAYDEIYEPKYEVPNTQTTHYSSTSLSTIRDTFEATKSEVVGKITAPKRKDFGDWYDDSEEEYYASKPISQVRASVEIDRALKESKPYAMSPSFQRIHHEFFPEERTVRTGSACTGEGLIEENSREGIKYEKNQYEDLVVQVDENKNEETELEAAKNKYSIRRMSKNNQWTDEELKLSTRRSVNLEDIIPPNSPFVKLPSSPSPRYDVLRPSSDFSPRTVSPAPIPSPRQTQTEHDVYGDRVSHFLSHEQEILSEHVDDHHVVEDLHNEGHVQRMIRLFNKPNQSSTFTIHHEAHIAPSGEHKHEQEHAHSISDIIINNNNNNNNNNNEEKKKGIDDDEREMIRNLRPFGDAVVNAIEEYIPSRRKSVSEMAKSYNSMLTHRKSSIVTSRDNSPERARKEIPSLSNIKDKESVLYVEIPKASDLSTVEASSNSKTFKIHRTLKTMVGQGVSVEAKQSASVTVAAPVTPVTPYIPVTPIASVAPVAPIEVICPAPQIRTTPLQTAYTQTASTSVSTSQQTTVTRQETSISSGNSSEEKKTEKTEEDEGNSTLERNGSGRRSWSVKTFENNIRFSNQKLKMPDIDYMTSNGHIRNSDERLNGEENSSLRDWDPRPLVKALYEVSYEPRVETKRNRFMNMEGHAEFPSDETNTVAELEREWKQLYCRTKEGRLQIFVTHSAEEGPAEEIVLCGTELEANRDDRTLHIYGGKEGVKLLIRVPSAVFDKWRQALLSHAASSSLDAYVKPTLRTMPHLTEKVVVIEIGSCSIRGGILTQEPSLPQAFFPSIAIRTNEGDIVVGEDAYTPEVRHSGEFVRPIQASDPAVERYTIDKEVVQACLHKVVRDLRVDPTNYRVLLSIPQNIPSILIGELISIALNVIKFQGAAITRQPSLILYAYDVTTGVVVDIGDRLNIVPVIDGYVVDSAICSIPYGATQVREALRSSLCANNRGLYSFQSPIEKLILRYVMEQTCFVPEEYGNQNETSEAVVSLEAFNPTPQMQSKFNIDSSRFSCTEGLFRPKKWNLDTKGLHQLVHEAVQMSPIDSRRTLYRNIYLAGGASLLPGLAEKLEQELAAIVPNTIHTQVHISPWRYNAAYLGAQIVASSSTFEDSCITDKSLSSFLLKLSSSVF